MVPRKKISPAAENTDQGGGRGEVEVRVCVSLGTAGERWVEGAGLESKQEGVVSGPCTHGPYGESVLEGER